jgi:hypothetical protein
MSASEEQKMVLIENCLYKKELTDATVMNTVSMTAFIHNLSNSSFSHPVYLFWAVCT